MSFIRDVITANSGNECPKEYILWAGYAALSLACGRRYFLETDHFTLDPRLYVVLVGPAGNRKTFARDFMVKILKKAIPDVILSANCESHQAIIQYMAQEDNVRQFINWKNELDQERPYGLFVSELMNYIKIDPTGFTSFLTDLRDSKDIYNYRIKGKDGTGVVDELHFPYFVLLACTAPDWLTTQIKSDEFCGGFGRRTIFVCNDSDIRLKPHKSDEAIQAELRAVAALVEIHKHAAKFQLTPEADDFFWEKWYKDKKVHVLSDDKFMKSFGRTEHIQVLNVAMLTCLSEVDWTLFDAKSAIIPITVDHIKLSISLIANIKHTMGMITSRMGKSEVIQAHQTVLDVLKSHGGIMLEKELRLLTLKEFKNTQEQWSVFEFMKTNEQIVSCTGVQGYGDKKCLALPERVMVVKKEPPKDESKTNQT